MALSIIHFTSLTCILIVVHSIKGKVSNIFSLSFHITRILLRKITGLKKRALLSIKGFIVLYDVKHKIQTNVTEYFV